MESGAGSDKRLTLSIGGKEKSLIALPAGMAKPAPASAHPIAAAPMAAVPMAVAPGAMANPAAGRQTIRARATTRAGHGAEPPAAGGEVHWSYEGENGPQASLPTGGMAPPRLRPSKS